MSRSSPIPARKPVLLFVVQAAALAVVLGYLPGSKVFYPTVFNAHANVVFGWFGEGRSLRFRTLPWEERADHSDTRLVGIGPHSRKAQWRVIYRSWTRGWWPTACVIGMVLATPLPLRRRIVSLVAGVLVLDGLVLLRVGALAVVLFGASEPGPPGANERWLAAVPVVRESFNSWVVPAASVLLAWAAVASPAATIELGSARTGLGRLLGAGGRRRSSPRDPAQQGGPGGAGGVAEEGQDDRRGDA